MRAKIVAVIGILCLPSLIEAASIVSYHARLSEQDHRDSAGRRLTSVAAILSQDRANYHRFHKRDPNDQGDSFFNSAQHRELFYRMKVTYYNFGKHPAQSIVSECLDVDIKVVDLILYVTVSAG